MDIERTVAQRLNGSTGFEVYIEVPDPRPDEFITVELTGGQAQRFIKTPTLAIQSWAQTRKRAYEMAQIVEQACIDLVDESNIFTAQPSGTYRWPDPESRQARYQMTLDLTICE